MFKPSVFDYIEKLESEETYKNKLLLKFSTCNKESVAQTKVYYTLNCLLLVWTSIINKISEYFEHYKIFACIILRGHKFIWNVYATQKGEFLMTGEAISGLN